MNKKIYFVIFSAILLALFLNIKSIAQAPFYKAIATCEDYQQDGSVNCQGEKFNILITLEKNKKGICTYKEKIYQDDNYQMLTCKFTQNQLPFLSDSMTRFNDTFKNQIAKNRIFEAKMTTNGEIFQKYLVDSQYCKITHSKN